MFPGSRKLSAAPECPLLIFNILSEPDCELTRLSRLFQDLPGASSITDLHDALCLSEVGERRLFIIGTHAKKGQPEPSSGTRDAWDLIIQLVGDGR